MRISLKWLKRYIDFELRPEELSDRLTRAGFEVEEIDTPGAKYYNFVVGRVLEVAKHPKADKLTVCSVNTGKETLQIVCGAPNVSAGQNVPVGLEGAEILHDQHDPEAKPFRLSNVQIRGVQSFGMICSEFELGLGDDKAGIMVLDKGAEPGTSLADYLGLNDTVLEVGITPNRPDAMSHIGIAREAGAILKKELAIPKLELKESLNKTEEFASVRVEDETDCPRYTARVILNVRIDQSPRWLKELLTVVGIRPVNNIVDVTNFVLMECGHPLHAFDYDRIAEHAILVRRARQGESFITLDHKNRALAPDTLMIADARSAVAIAGVMGGENTEISDSTKNVLIESAYFKPESVRRTAKRFGLSTDASQRFERGADPNITKWAVDRASQLIQEISGGEILKGVIDVYPVKLSEKEIELRIDKTNELLGLSLSGETIKFLLGAIGITPLGQGKDSSGRILRFGVPTNRPDLEREIDLIEEVARLYGYDNISTTNRATIDFPADAPALEFTEELRNWAIGSGMMEVVANSMQEMSVASLVSDKIVQISNPISKDMAALRTSLIPGMLEIVRNNIFHGTKTLRLFECGKVYFKDRDSAYSKYVEDFVEIERIIFLFTGLAEPRSWDRMPRNFDIFDLKGEIQTLFDKILLDNIKFIPYPNTKALTENGLHIEINGEYAGQLGGLEPGFLKKFEIEQDVYVAELEIPVLEKYKRTLKKFKVLSKYPAVMRDIAIIVGDELPAKELEEEIRSSASPQLVRVELFDVFRGDQAGEGKKSCAYALEFMSEDHTMAQKEIDDLMANIVNRLTKKFGATIRKQEISN